MYEVKRAYPSHLNKEWVTARFMDHDSIGNPHLLDISGGSDLEFVLIASAFLIARYRAGAFELFCNDVSEREMVQRLRTAFDYLKANQEQPSSLWSVAGGATRRNFKGSRSSIRSLLGR
jgi:hypothetical protein